MKSSLPRSFLLAAVTLGATAFAADAPPAPQVVPSIIITGARESYAAPSAVSSLRSDTELLDVPQSVQVITSKLIADQQALDPTVVVRNFSGVVGMDVREINFASYLIRGFSSQAYLDGFQLYGNGPNLDSLVNVDRIEVVKGPTGTLFGGANGGPLGGLLNFVSKEPERVASRSITLSGGSFGAYGASWDVNQPLDASGKVLFRLTGEWRETRDTIPGITGNIQGLYPTLSWAVSDDTSVLFRARVTERSQTDYAGLPAVGTVNPGPTTYRSDFLFHAVGQPQDTVKNTGFNVELKHKINNTWKLTASANYLDSQLKEYYTYFDTSAPAGSVYVDTGSMPISIKTLSLNTVLNGKIDAGLIRHDVSLGLDLDRTEFVGTMWIAGNSTQVNVTPPGSFPAFDPGAYPMMSVDNAYKTVGLFAQDELVIDKKFHLSGSLRWTRLAIDDIDPTQSLNSHPSYDKVTTRFGAAYDATQSLTFFTGWGQGFQAPIETPIAAGPVPVTAEQWEVGAKVKFGNDVQGSIAYFNNERQHVPVAVNPWPNHVQTGHQRAKGVELDLVWQVTREFSLLANYAHQDVVDFSTGLLVDRIPQDSGRRAARYDFKQGELAGLGVGLGWTVVSRQQGDPANTYSTPGYGLVDAQLSYVKGNVTYSLGVENLLNAKYYKPFTFLGTSVAPGAPRTVSAQATLKF